MRSSLSDTDGTFHSARQQSTPGYTHIPRGYLLKVDYDSAKLFLSFFVRLEIAGESEIEIFQCESTLGPEFDDLESIAGHLKLECFHQIPQRRLIY